MKKLLATTLVVCFASFAMAKEQPKKTEPEPVCGSKAAMNMAMDKQGFYDLLDMTNKEGVVETIWIGSNREIIITATIPDVDKSCLLASMTNVIYNSETVDALFKAMEKATKQKEI